MQLNNKTIDNIEFLPDFIKFFPHFLKPLIEIELNELLHCMVDKASIVVF